jgi:hypothetical protein
VMGASYLTGREAEGAMAEWFADIWQRFSYTHGVHLRMILLFYLANVTRSTW